MSVDNAQYEKVVATYDSILGTAVRRSDTLNMLHCIGSVEGKSVLDFSTGTGYFARTLSKMGAKHVVGVDVSQGMLDAARNVTEREPQIPGGVAKYELGDVFKPLKLLHCPEASRDLITGAWCLNYAGDQTMMDQAWRNIARYLKPGGRFVGVIPNDYMPWLGDDERYFDFSYKRIDQVKDGHVCKLTLHAKEQPVSFNAYILAHSVFETGAKSAWLVDVALTDPTLLPEFEGTEEEELLEQLLGSSPVQSHGGDKAWAGVSWRSTDGRREAHNI
ncbi:hypothetical protein INS49_015329 [Diaporthe citri]|uniref:uncharacterized protein n=1 Tax=Diaporthe citri TaxID=83186 RepID=UPI001C7FFDA6|nr:uncharacterized protein INS49_015329 [Diaporthe citri]KAG6355945.1 hypothetical protein INS49_015329 [Diaporthe citri]